jgi:hypothetical protein
MNLKQQLAFVSPSADAFLAFLCPLWDEGIRNIQLVGNNGLAQQVAAEAAKKNLTLEYNPTADRGSIANSQVTVFTETEPETLSAQLLACVDIPEMIILAPLTDRHFSKNPLFLIAIPKGGTHLLFELAQALGFHSGVEPPPFPHPQTWYCLEYSNPHTIARDFFVDTVRRSAFGNRHHVFTHTPTLFIYRHPLDILVSEANYYHQDGKTAFYGYLSQCNFNERLDHLMNDPWLLGTLRERIGGFVPWLSFPNVIPVSFEELVGEAGGGDRRAQHNLIWSLQLKLHVPGITEEIGTCIFNPDSPTFRKGLIGRYVAHLTPETISTFAQENQDLLAAFGYPLDGSPSLPKKAEDRRKSPLCFSKIDFNNMPIIIESEFLGCNLIRYNNCFMAIPMTAGRIAIDQLSPELLNELPTGTTLWDLKSLLLTGTVQSSQYRKALDQLARALKKEISTDVVHSYWKDSDQPRFIEKHQGFRIVFFRGMYIGIHESLYYWTSDAPLHDWVKGADTDKVMVSTSREGLLADIEGLTTVRRIKLKREELAERVKRIIKALYYCKQCIELNKKRWTDEKNTLEKKMMQLQSELDSTKQLLNQAMVIINDLHASNKN